MATQYEFYHKRMTQHLKTAECAEQKENWKAAAEEFYLAYCEHPSKFEADAKTNPERNSFLDRAAECWEKHKTIFEVGQTVKMPSGLGGIFTGKIEQINGDRIHIRIDNSQSDFHKRPFSRSYKETTIIK